MARNPFAIGQLGWSAFEKFAVRAALLGLSILSYRTIRAGLPLSGPHFQNDLFQPTSIFHEILLNCRVI